ncbi:hypothetical protein BK730_00270 [Bacillus wiedmannii]|uniref:SLH domain-containing protein n=1 Tax=Bacillus wiedmannii TaxID=1890302 RepID=A0A242ZPD4_9BACI|nr:hypothetical protein BK730_00270 [Bacillus wiedmannii]
MIGDIILKKSYIKALVVATTLAIPFATYSTPALAALKAEANQSVAAASERTYDTEIKIYKDQKDEPSMVSQYIKNPKVAIEDGTPLAKMTQLTELDLPNNELKDITPLSNLVNLQKLDLEANYISDLSPVSKLNKLVYLSFVANEIRDVRPVIELSKKAYINVQNQKVFLEDTEVNKEVKVPIYEKDGEVSTKIRLKSDGGTYSNGVVKWSTPGEKVYEFGVKDPFNDTGIFFTGSVIQKVVNEKVAEEVIEFKDVPKGHWAEGYVKALADNNISKGDGKGNFLGDDFVTREQYAQFLYNAI